MRTEINSKVQTSFLTAEDILKYFLESDDRIDTMVKCKTESETIQTTDKDLYEALGSIKEYDNFQLAKLVKFFESVSVRSANKKLLTHERVEELRKSALSGRKSG